MANRVPIECYEQFGTDLDGCSTQQNEGCGRCHPEYISDKVEWRTSTEMLKDGTIVSEKLITVREGGKPMIIFADYSTPEEFPCDNCEWNINNCCNYPQTDIDCCVLGSKRIKKIID